MDNQRAVRLLSLCGADLIDFINEEKHKQHLIQLKIERNLPYPHLSETEAKRDILIAEHHLNPELALLNL